MYNDNWLSTGDQRGNIRANRSQFLQLAFLSLQQSKWDEGQ